ncbi:hypothetical protein WMY93_015871 [Mugilogobius chulae]|uniref:Uncharacterized protein n=1 Tax=Mugilogobius chulae TaxID=88201 RepID=A0AAW0P1F7_9GOBI
MIGDRRRGRSVRRWDLFVALKVGCCPDDVTPTPRGNITRLVSPRRGSVEEEGEEMRGAWPVRAAHITVRPHTQTPSSALRKLPKQGHANHTDLHPPGLFHSAGEGG